MTALIDTLQARFPAVRWEIDTDTAAGFVAGPFGRQDAAAIYQPLKQDGAYEVSTSSDERGIYVWVAPRA